MSRMRGRLATLVTFAFSVPCALAGPRRDPALEGMWRYVDEVDRHADGVQRDTLELRGSMDVQWREGHVHPASGAGEVTRRSASDKALLPIATGTMRTFAPVVSRLIVALILPTMLIAQATQRARAWGIPFEGETGTNNAITDVRGVEVGHSTIIRGEGKLVPGVGPVRTGVTAILPRGKGNWDFVMAATFNQNGNGDMTGVNWIEESGFLEGPLLLTGTHSVGTVRDATVKWQEARGRQFIFTYPVVAETFDLLNDATGQHVKPEHAWAALDSAHGGPVTEGPVGGGTGMGCNGFKGGIGTSSRTMAIRGTRYTVGVLVQCNYGGDLRILGVPVGREITDLRMCSTMPQTRFFLQALSSRPCRATAPSPSRDSSQAGPVDDGPLGRGSIVVIVATDAPLLSHQLKRVARRVGMGLGALGSWAGNGSGDLFLAFSTANPTAGREGVTALSMLSNDDIDPIFRATIGATEEAVVNAMLAAPPVFTGVDGLRVYGLPGSRVVDAMRKYGRMK